MQLAASSLCFADLVQGNTAACSRGKKRRGEATTSLSAPALVLALALFKKEKRKKYKKKLLKRSDPK